MENLLLEWLSIDGLLVFGIGVLASIISVMFGAVGFVISWYTDLCESCSE
ncbi:hypothetical protein [Peribacillus asahii]|nr:hypothetical protein [Peribacillus asahii]USK58212.1 hypothetical protein LIT37_13135 [Peribacillus asahii]